MTPTQIWILWIYAAIVALWPIRHIALFFILKHVPLLKRDSPRYDQPTFPRVTAIIPAKDEQDALAGCLATVAAQDYPDLEILVVDDRSTDGTPAVAAAFAASEPRARVVTIKDLPAGWTGKTHALHAATRQATGTWLWYVDADTRHEPMSLSVCLEDARRHGASLMSLIPRMRCETFWENVVQPLAGIVLMQNYSLSAVNNPRKKVAFANGQYILIEKRAYDAVGGHESVKQWFVEDIHLARLVKAEGFPIRTSLTAEISSTRMYTNLPQIVRGWSRILYDALDRSIPALAWKIIEPLVWSQTAHVALVAALALLTFGHGSTWGGPFAAWLLVLAVSHQVLAFTVLWRMYRLSAPTTKYVIWYPLAGLVLDWILLRAIASCLTGRVTWRGTAYGPAVTAQPAEPEPAPTR
jgi:cellulose synthase/poly-beta-1,6-N-acetylglucosamine synthase-like glycosyltransferase